MECRKSTKAVVAAGMCAVMLIGAAGMSVSSYLFGGDGIAAADRELTPTTEAVESGATDLDGDPKLNSSIETVDTSAFTDEFDETAVAGSLALPIDDATIGSGFLGYYGHTGVDFTAEGIHGRDIHAALGGTVVASGWGGSNGNRVIIDHGDDVRTVYANCDTLSVKVGDKVKQGDTIATVGRTGNVTGPHLHFELRIKGTPVNPKPYLPAED